MATDPLLTAVPVGDGLELLPGGSWTAVNVTALESLADGIAPQLDRAKTVRLEQGGAFQWGDVPDDSCQRAHDTKKMNCIACHTSWNASCYGCHLPQKANRRSPSLHNEGDVIETLARLAEAASIREYFAKFGDRLPEGLQLEVKKLDERLRKATP